MNDIQLKDVDLNLLVVFDVLLQERSVTRAAERLDLTPSAVSHALRRLRELFDDELQLLVRSDEAAGLTPPDCKRRVTIGG